MSYNLRQEAIKRPLELRKMYGAPANDHREGEFFFYANNRDNAFDLLNKPRKMNYIVECVQRESDDEKFLIKRRNDG